MARGFPSMTALLGLIAVAGYQNRDKIAELLRSGTASAGGTNPDPGPGGLLGNGIGELLERFRQSGRAETAQSWVGTGPNNEITPTELEQAIGEDTLDDLATKTGLSRQELLARLSRDLPAAVDRFTPDGRVPQD